MSMDLAVWYSTRPLDKKQALAIYQGLCNGELAVLEGSERIDAFLSDLHGVYAALDDLSEEEAEKSPWAGDFDRSDGHVIMSITWSGPDDAPELVVKLAAEHGLICFDPQSCDVYLPPELKHDKSKRWWNLF